jgi:hypothetical protein
MADELEVALLKQDAGFLSGLGSLIQSFADEIVVIMFGAAYSIMTYQAMMNGLAVPYEYSGVVVAVVVDYVKKKWASET